MRTLRTPKLLVPALALALPTLAASALAKGAIKGAIYSGTTSEQIPVSFKVSKSGKQIREFTTRLAYNGHCGQGGGPSYEIKIRTIGVSASGKFSATTKGAFKGVSAIKPVTVKVSGRISGRDAGGSVVEPTNRCTAPHKGVLPYSETFTARAA